MDEREWQEIIARASRDVGGIIRSQRVLDEINATLRDRRQLEEDFIFRDAFGRDPGAPLVTEIDGVEITARILHKRGLRQSDIKGADLLYEIAGRKFVLVQYKSPDLRDRVTKDSNQLNELMSACPNPCPPWVRGHFVNCGSWYSIQSPTESLYLPACSAAAIFGDAASRSFSRFSRGIPADAFQSIFGRCWTGAHIAPFDIAGLTWSVMEADRALFSVVQRGTFGRW